MTASTHILATGRINKWGSSLRVAPHTPAVAEQLDRFLAAGIDHQCSLDDAIEDAAYHGGSIEDDHDWIRYGC